jgi:dienelactone hydrolase
MRTPFLFRTALLALILFLSNHQARAVISLEQALDPRGFTHATLSPDGKHIAMIGFSNLVYGLFLTNVEQKSIQLLIEGKRVEEGHWAFDKNPLDVIWITNELMLVNYGPQLESITLEGKRVAEIGWSASGTVEILGKAESEQADSTTFLMSIGSDRNEIGLADAKTGKISKFKLPPGGKLIKWAFDRHGQFRAATLLNSAFWKDASSISHWYKASANAEWEKLAEFKISDDYWSPMFVPDEPNSLIVSDNSLRDTRAIFRYDIKQRALVDMLAGHPTQDIIDVSGLGNAAFRSVRTNGMISQGYWFDPVWQRVQTAVDQALPKRINVLSGNPNQRVLIYSYADVDPGTWYLLDLQTHALNEIARVRHAVDPAQMQPMQAINYPARDGLVIPAWLTQPSPANRQSTGAQPTVVLVHGGPIARDYWQWDKEVQLLVSHGYVVFQPQFRGSAGFGKKFTRAGYGQWDLTMQDDITAGVEYLIKQGTADPKRICISGASYGGYAALWGLIKTPNLYQCGISFAGVVDIEYMFHDSSDTNSDKVGREWRRVQIGDAKQDKEKFDQVSPLKHSDKIVAPVLLMHGEQDQRVPIAHAQKMKRALEQNHKVVEWLTFDDEGHGLYYLENEYRYFKKMLPFLDKYIGPGTGKASPAKPETSAASAPAEATNPLPNAPPK